MDGSDEELERNQPQRQVHPSPADNRTENSGAPANMEGESQVSNYIFLPLSNPATLFKYCNSFS